MELLGATATNVGNVRETNQDRAWFGGYVAVVADGMGGHQGGETAATIAVSEFRTITDPIGPGGLVELVEDANRAVFERAADPELRGMGTTLVALTLRPTESKVSIVNVGDSRAYFLRGAEFGQVTDDHSLVEDLVRQGRLTPEEAANHPQRNILTRALGISSHVEVDQFLLPTKVGDRFLLCSDGLFNEVQRDEIQRLLTVHHSPQEAARALVDAALSGAGRDNITVAVVDVVDDGHGGSLSPLTAEEEALFEVPPPADAGPAAGGPGPGPGPGGNGAHPGGPGPHAGPAVGIGAQPAGGGVLLDAPAPAGPAAAPAGRPRLSQEVLSPAEVAAAPALEAPRESFASESDLDVRIEPAPGSGARSRGRAAGVLLAGVLLGVVLGLGYLAPRWYSHRYWFVQAADGRVALFQGKQGGFLWADPVLKRADGPLVVELMPDKADEVQKGRDFPSQAEAQRYVDQLTQSAEELAAETGKLNDFGTTSVPTTTPLPGTAGGNGGAPSIPGAVTPGSVSSPTSSLPAGSDTLPPAAGTPGSGATSTTN